MTKQMFYHYLDTEQYEFLWLYRKMLDFLGDTDETLSKPA